MSIKMIILAEDRLSGGLIAEHGFSALIESDGKSILFDTGASDAFLRNAGKLSINLEKIEHIILSHGHYDHGDGLMHIKNKSLVCHPDCFKRRYNKTNDRYVGLKMTKAQAEKQLDLTLTRKPYKITDRIIFLGEIPRNLPFEVFEPRWYTEGGEDDMISDDSALVIKTDSGLDIIAGCSHSGICNIAEYAKRVTGSSCITSVTGGFHLLKPGSRALKTREYFCSEKIRDIRPMHCVSEEVKKILKNPETRQGRVQDTEI